MDANLYKTMLAVAVAMLGVVITRGFRRSEPWQTILDASLMPGFLVLLFLAHLVSRWSIPLVVGMAIILLKMFWNIIRSKRL